MGTRLGVVWAALLALLSACTAADPNSGDGGRDAQPDFSVQEDVASSDALPPDATLPDATEPRDVPFDSTVETCGDARLTWCFQRTVEGLCNDVNPVRAYCMAQQWMCPAGYLLESRCPCGVPPNPACLRDSGNDGFVVDRLVSDGSSDVETGD